MKLETGKWKPEKSADAERVEVQVLKVKFTHHRYHHKQSVVGYYPLA